MATVRQTPKSPIEQFTDLATHYESRPEEALNFASDLLQLTAQHVLKSDLRVPELPSYPTDSQKDDFRNEVRDYLKPSVGMTPSLQGALAFIISDCLSLRPDVATNCNLVKGFVSTPKTTLQIDKTHTEFKNPLWPAEPVERRPGQRTESLFTAVGNLNTAQMNAGQIELPKLASNLFKGFSSPSDYDLQGKIVLGLNMALSYPVSKGEGKSPEVVANGLRDLSGAIDKGEYTAPFKIAFHQAVAEIRREASDLGHTI
jgi:hypothetical protein